MRVIKNKLFNIIQLVLIILQYKVLVVEVDCTLKWHLYIYVIKKLNHQNDRIWVKGIEDINDDKGTVKWFGKQGASKFLSRSRKETSLDPE